MVPSLRGGRDPSFLFSIRSRGMIELGFEVDIALPKGSALRGLVTVEGTFAQSIP